MTAEMEGSVRMLAVLERARRLDLEQLWRGRYHVIGRASYYRRVISRCPTIPLKLSSTSEKYGAVGQHIGA